MSAAANSSMVIWQRFQENAQQGKIAHALLLIDASGLYLEELSLKLATLLLCAENSPPCMQCQSCQLMALKEHPDWIRIQPDNAGGLIKIDQIRELHQRINTTPQLNHNQVIVLAPAEKMNKAAANALLKTLEEPPPNTFFILLAKWLCTIPPTILSRCQQWQMKQEEPIGDNYYAAHPMKEELPQMIHQLEQLLLNEQTIPQLAQCWGQYEINALCSFLYLLIADLIRCRLGLRTHPTLSPLAQKMDLLSLFKQLDQLNTFIKQMHHNSNDNQQLMLELFLLGFRV